MPARRAQPMHIRWSSPSSRAAVLTLPTRSSTLRNSVFGYQTPEAIRRIGLTRLAAWLKKRGCRNSAKMAEKALEAANSQHTVLPAQSTGSALVVRLAEQINAIDAEIADVDAQITDLFRQHDSADVLLSMPGFGPVLAATFLSNIGGNLDGFDSVDRLASVAVLAPVPRDSGRISGNLHRPRRFNRRLLRTCYIVAFTVAAVGSLVLVVLDLVIGRPAAGDIFIMILNGLAAFLSWRAQKIWVCSVSLPGV